MTINNAKPGNQKIEIGKDGNELKKRITIRCEATIWNEAMEAANYEGIPLNIKVRKFLLDLAKEYQKTKNKT